MVKVTDIPGGLPALTGAAIAAAGLLARSPGLFLAGAVVGVIGLVRGTESEFARNLVALPQLTGDFVGDLPAIFTESLQRSTDRQLLPDPGLFRELADRPQAGFVLGKPFNAFRIVGRIDDRSRSTVTVRVENQGTEAQFGPVSLRVAERSAVTGTRTANVSGPSVRLQPREILQHEFTVPTLIGPPNRATTLTTSLFWRNFKLDEEVKPNSFLI